MEFIYESIALGVDFLVLGLYFMKYVACKKAFDTLEKAPLLSIDEDLKDVVGGHKCQRYPYAVVQGTVSSIRAPLVSDKSPSVTGVIQVVKLNELRSVRHLGCIWTNELKSLEVLSKEVPFKITNGPSCVEVINGLSASKLDLDLVYDNYEPASITFFDYICGFFAGVRPKGFHKTEEILRDGTTITGIGEIELDGNTLRLQSSSVGPMILTKETKETLLKKFKEVKSSTIAKIVFCGTAAFILVSIIVWKFYTKKRQGRIKRQTEDRKNYLKESSLSAQNNLSANYPNAEKLTRLENSVFVISSNKLECQGQNEEKNCNLKKTLNISTRRNLPKNIVTARRTLNTANLSCVGTSRPKKAIPACSFEELKNENQERIPSKLMPDHRKQFGKRSQNLNDDQLCVNCVINVKEMKLFPCGHVCLCENCSEDIRNCPECRKEIETAAVLS